MSKGTRTPLGMAQTLAKKLREGLLKSSPEVMIVGSVRREKATVGDIEMVILAEETALSDLFGQAVAHTSTSVDLALDMGTEDPSFEWIIRKNDHGSKTKRLIHRRTNIVCDLYVVTDRRAWGTFVAVRTGPHPFSKTMMEKAHDLGMCFASGFLLHNHPKERSKSGCRLGASCPNIIPLYNESDVFENLKIPYMTPPEREAKYGIG